LPDVDLAHYGELSDAARDILSVTSLPVLIDGDNGYGDVKNVTRTVRGYEMLGASAIFIEDQHGPKRCGHMSGKTTIPLEDMVFKIKAALAAREDPDFFFIARSDAIAADGFEDAMRRGEAYLKAGADGLFIEGPESVEQIEKIASTFKGASLVVNIFEGGGKTPVLPPKDLHEMGFAMVVYPTSLLFRVARTLEKALHAMKAGEMVFTEDEGTTFDQYEAIVGLPEWAELEKRFGKG
jgi:2-methylisocitrate lyase-like PEP mutase family enzyme